MRCGRVLRGLAGLGVSAAVAGLGGVMQGVFVFGEGAERSGVRLVGSGPFSWPNHLVDIPSRVVGPGERAGLVRRRLVFWFWIWAWMRLVCWQAFW